VFADKLLYLGLLQCDTACTVYLCVCYCADSCCCVCLILWQMSAAASRDKMDHILHGRKVRLVAVAIFILLALTCYFCWEILYQERVILNILRMSKTSSHSANEPKIALGSDHLEEVVESYFDQQKREVFITFLCWLKLFYINNILNVYIALAVTCYGKINLQDGHTCLTFFNFLQSA